MEEVEGSGGVGEEWVFRDEERQGISPTGVWQPVVSFLPEELDSPVPLVSSHPGLSGSGGRDGESRVEGRRTTGEGQGGSQEGTPEEDLGGDVVDRTEGVQCHVRSVLATTPVHVSIPTPDSGTRGVDRVVPHSLRFKYKGKPPIHTCLCQIKNYLIHGLRINKCIVNV